MIGCRDLVVRAGERTILTVPWLDVAAGQTLAVLGPNGAGKSTLLRALGLLRPAEGTVLLRGEPAERAAMRTAVAAVLQRPVLRRGTVLANAASGLRMRGVRRREAELRAVPWLARLGLAELVRRDVRTLSGGEAQRVSIARALAVEPAVLLLDEPLAGVDATTRSELMADLGAVLTELDAATVLVTHDRAEAMALASRTALLVDGTVRQIGPTQHVLDAPVDAECARLLGYTNVVPPGLSGEPSPIAARPEHCRPVADARDAPPGAVVFGADLRRVVSLGDTTRIDADAAGTALACLVPGGVPGWLGGPGSRLTLCIPREHVRRLEAAVEPAREGESLLSCRAPSVRSPWSGDDAAERQRTGPRWIA